MHAGGDPETLERLLGRQREVLPWLPTVVRGPEGQLAIDGTMPTDSVLLFNGIDLMDGYSGAYNQHVRLTIDFPRFDGGVVQYAMNRC